MVKWGAVFSSSGSLQAQGRHSVSVFGLITSSREAQCSYPLAHYRLKGGAVSSSVSVNVLVGCSVPSPPTSLELTQAQHKQMLFPSTNNIYFTLFQDNTGYITVFNIVTIVYATFLHFEEIVLFTRNALCVSSIFSSITLRIVMRDSPDTLMMVLTYVYYQVLYNSLIHAKSACCLWILNWLLWQLSYTPLTWLSGASWVSGEDTLTL